MKTCLICSTPLPPQARGRPRLYCDNCGPTPTPTPEQREAKRAGERSRYAQDPDFRARQLDARKRRYAADLERERERGRRYYAANRARVLARANARNAARRRGS